MYEYLTFIDYARMQMAEWFDQDPDHFFETLSQMKYRDLYFVILALDHYADYQLNHVIVEDKEIDSISGTLGKYFDQESFLQMWKETKQQGRKKDQVVQWVEEHRPIDELLSYCEKEPEFIYLLLQSTLKVVNGHQGKDVLFDQAPIEASSLFGEYERLYKVSELLISDLEVLSKKEGNAIILYTQYLAKRHQGKNHIDASLELAIDWEPAFRKSSIDHETFVYFLTLYYEWAKGLSLVKKEALSDFDKEVLSKVEKGADVTQIQSFLSAGPRYLANFLSHVVSNVGSLKIPESLWTDTAKRIRAKEQSSFYVEKFLQKKLPRKGLLYQPLLPYCGVLYSFYSLAQPIDIDEEEAAFELLEEIKALPVLKRDQMIRTLCFNYYLDCYGEECEFLSYWEECDVVEDWIDYFMEDEEVLKEIFDLNLSLAEEEIDYPVRYRQYKRAIKEGQEDLLKERYPFYQQEWFALNLAELSSVDSLEADFYEDFLSSYQMMESREEALDVMSMMLLVGDWFSPYLPRKEKIAFYRRVLQEGYRYQKGIRLLKEEENASPLFLEEALKTSTDYPSLMRQFRGQKGAFREIVDNYLASLEHSFDPVQEKIHHLEKGKKYLKVFEKIDKNTNE